MNQSARGVNEVLEFRILGAPPGCVLFIGGAGQRCCVCVVGAAPLQHHPTALNSQPGRVLHAEATSYATKEPGLFSTLHSRTVRCTHHATCFIVRIIQHSNAGRRAQSAEPRGKASSGPVASLVSRLLALISPDPYPNPDLFRVV